MKLKRFRSGDRFARQVIVSEASRPTFVLTIVSDYRKSWPK